MMSCFFPRNQSGALPSEVGGAGPSLERRVAWMLRYAGTACLATSLTTACSFLANMASVLRAMREFGLFMGLCVIVVYLNVFFLYPPVCILCNGRLSCLKRSKPASQGGTGKGAAVAQQSQTFADALRWFFSSKWPRNLWHWRGPIVATFTIFLVVFLATSLSMARTDANVPVMFPEDHNQNAGKKVIARFQRLDEIDDRVILQGFLDGICYDGQAVCHKLVNGSSFVIRSQEFHGFIATEGGMSFSAIVGSRLHIANLNQLAQSP